MWIAVGATHGRLKQSARPRRGRTETVKLATPVSHFITTCQRSPAAGAERHHCPSGGGRLPVVADCKVHPDGVRIAWGLGKLLLSGRIEIQGVAKFCFLQKTVFG